MSSSLKHCPASEEEPLLMPEPPKVTNQSTGAIPKIKNPNVQKKNKTTGKNKDEAGNDIDSKDTMSKDEQKSKPILKIFQYFKSLKMRNIHKNTRHYKIVASADLTNEDLAISKEVTDNAQHNEKKNEKSFNNKLKRVAPSLDLVSLDLDKVTDQDDDHLELKLEKSFNNTLKRVAPSLDLVSLDLDKVTDQDADHLELKLAEDLKDYLKHGGSVKDKNTGWNLVDNWRKIKELERQRGLLFEPLPPLTEILEEDMDFEEKENATYAYKATKSGKLDLFDVIIENRGNGQIVPGNEHEEILCVDTNVKPDDPRSLCHKCEETALFNKIKFDLGPDNSDKPISMDIPLYHYVQIGGVFKKVHLEEFEKNINSNEFNPNPFEIYIGRFLTIRKLCNNAHKSIWIAFDSTTCKFVFMEYYVEKELKVNADELISTVEITVPSWECDLKILCEFVTCFNVLFDDCFLRCIVRAPIDKDVFEEIGQLHASFDKIDMNE